MKIAKDINGNAIQCDGNTSAQGIYNCYMCNQLVHPCNDLKIEHGRKKDYYFAHYSNICSGSVESYFHRIAKAVIAGANEINLPDGKFPYGNVKLECTSLHPSIRPDLLLDDELVVEVCYSNPKTTTQINIFKDLNISALEIDLCQLTLSSTLDEIRWVVLEDKSNRHYLSKRINPVVDIPTTHSRLHPFFIFLILVAGIIGLRALTNYFRQNRRNRIRQSYNRLGFRYNSSRFIDTL